jgi:hypothetical protein
MPTLVVTVRSAPGDSISEIAARISRLLPARLDSGVGQEQDELLAAVAAGEVAGTNR